MQDDQDPAGPPNPDGPGGPDPAGGIPAPLRAAAGLVLVEGLVTVGFGVVEAVHTNSDRVLLGATAAVFFVLYGVALGLCSWGMNHARSWSRGPVLLSQLMLLGLAWSIRDVALALAISAAVVAVLVLAGTLHPQSVDVLNREEHRRHD